MAKRFNVSIPDALAERMEPFKSNLSLSALMQDAIERELTRLTMSDMDKELRKQFKATAMQSWARRLPGLAAAFGQYIELLVDQAVNDRIPGIFDALKSLHCHTKSSEIMEEFERQWRGADPEFAKIKISHFMALVEEIATQAMDVGYGFARHIQQEAQNGKFLFDKKLYAKDDGGEICLGHEIEGVLTDYDNGAIYSFYYEAMLSRVRSLMTEEEIAEYVFNLDYLMAFEGEVV